MEHKHLEQFESETTEEFGKRLVNGGYLQTSHRHRHIGRVPPGKTALEALEEIAPAQVVELRKRLEQWALGDLLRVYGFKEHGIQLTIEQFAAFRKAGGQAV